LALGYRACLWSRLANRILLPIADAPVEDGDDLYGALKAVNWRSWFSVDRTLAIDFSGENRAIRNTHFGALRSKDAVVDWFVEDCGQRPVIDKKSPDIRLNVRLAKGKVRVALDFSGGSLHRRGYREKQGAAPLKENLAAAILLRADWPGMAARGGALVDPMCGSATLLLEAAMMSADMAPALRRRRFGFEAWAGHNEAQWRVILSDAKGRAEKGMQSQLPEIRGYDADARVIARAQENIAKLGFEKVVRVTCKPLAELKKPTHIPLDEGLVICNPPYGERLGEKASLTFLYRELGEAMMREFSGWKAAIFTSDAQLGRATGLRSHKRYALFNGALPSTLFLFDLGNNELRQPQRTAPESSADIPLALNEGAQMFANRIRKNRKRLSSWVKREGVECYRLYDADMPEYAVAVDIYGDHVHVAEYRAPESVDSEAAAKRLEEISLALPGALGVPTERIVYKQRLRQKGSKQYEKQDSQGELLSVREGQVKLLVNLRDYLDTGLFLDHRPLRLRLAAEVRGKDFLNLFCYTGTASVHAAKAGARSTTSVDMSNTYLGWLRKNLAHNGLGEADNHIVRADCLKWLQESQAKYDLVMLDPPSFSNSSSMEQNFDVQRDHFELINSAMAVLRQDGTLYFSNNRRGFKLAPELAEAFDCEDITRQTLDADFQRNQRIHVCWQIRHKKN
jgi:23S rRNA (guanine2069-N7)-methyltransferase / 23S rRNA (guanine2445-N2)-methyltransferase